MDSHVKKSKNGLFPSRHKKSFLIDNRKKSSTLLNGKVIFSSQNGLSLQALMSNENREGESKISKISTGRLGSYESGGIFGNNNIQN